MEEKNKIKIISPFRNAGHYLEKCVSSIMSQRYSDYKVVFINDCSTDGCEKYLPEESDKVKIITNTVRKTALENIFNAIMFHSEPDELIVLVDADDWLLTRNALKTIDEFFQSQKCWVSWGSCQWYGDVYNRKDFSSPYSKAEFKNLRKAPFRFSHIRCFYSGLFKKIQEQDENFSIFKDKKGEFYKSCYDVPIMFSLSEMASFERCYHNPVKLYAYNRETDLNDDKINQKLQTFIHEEVSNKMPFKPIENYL